MTTIGQVGIFRDRLAKQNRNYIECSISDINEDTLK